MVLAANFREGNLLQGGIKFPSTQQLALSQHGQASCVGVPEEGYPAMPYLLVYPQFWYSFQWGGKRRLMRGRGLPYFEETIRFDNGRWSHHIVNYSPTYIYLASIYKCLQEVHSW